MKRWEIPGGIRFVTFSCEHCLPLLRNPAIRDVFAQSLTAARKRCGFELFAWVAMPEHVHIIVRPRKDESLDRALLFLKMSVAQRVITRWREINAPILEKITRPDGTQRFWQKGGGFDRNIHDEGEFDREVCYIHRNPVKRGLVAESPAPVGCDAAPWIVAEQRSWYV